MKNRETNKTNVQETVNDNKLIPSPIRPVTVEKYDQHPPIIREPKKTTQTHGQNLKQNDPLHICTLNTRTLRTAESLQELESALTNLKWDILGISEMRRVGEEIEERDHYIMYHKGEIEGHRGVGFLIKLKHKVKVKEFEGISDRIVILHMNIPEYKKDWTIIQVYAPTEQASKSDIDDFYNKLSEIVRRYYCNHLILMGDFNAQVGTREEGEEFILGKYGYGKRSFNGQKLIGFLLENNLTLLNTLFIKNPKTKWTWISPDGKYKNEIDYIITNKPKSFCDTHVIQNLNFNTNHRMVRGCLNMHIQKKSRKNIINKRMLSSQQNFEKADTSITKFLREIANSDTNVLEKYKRIETKLSEVMKAKPKNIKANKLSDKTLDLLEKRKKLISNKKSKENLNEIANLSKQIRENMRKDRKTKRIQTLEDHIKRTGGIRKALKELREKGKDWISNLKNKQVVIRKRNEIQRLATDYYRTLYSDKNTNSNFEIGVQQKKAELYNDEPVPPILTIEVEKAINSQKLEKAPGPDRIPNELMRGTIKEISPILAKIFNEIIQTGLIPNQWGESHIILLHKKGARDDIGNYRPISLMSNIYKVFAKVILERISKQLDENQPIEQAGFRKKIQYD